MAPAGRPAQRAQVKPPLPQDEAFGAPHGMAPSLPVPLLANVENCFATLPAPHAGQATPVPSAPTRWSTSKRRPHSRQVYSYRGISALRNPSRGSPRGRSGHPRGRPRQSSRSTRSSGTARAGPLTWGPASVPCRSRGKGRPAPSPGLAPSPTSPTSTRTPAQVLQRRYPFPPGTRSRRVRSSLPLVPGARPGWEPLK